HRRIRERVWDFHIYMKLSRIRHTLTSPVFTLTRLTLKLGPAFCAAVRAIPSLKNVNTPALVSPRKSSEAFCTTQQPLTFSAKVFLPELAPAPSLIGLLDRVTNLETV